MGGSFRFMSSGLIRDLLPEYDRMMPETEVSVAVMPLDFMSGGSQYGLILP